MSVKNLRTPEDGISLDTREPKGADSARAAIDRVKNGEPTAEQELQAIRQRAAAARELSPEGGFHCSDCAAAWAAGRDAAIKAIEGE